MPLSYSSKMMRLIDDSLLESFRPFNYEHFDTSFDAIDKKINKTQ